MARVQSAPPHALVQSAPPATTPSPASPDEARLHAAIRAALRPKTAWWLTPASTTTSSDARHPPLPPLVRSLEEPRRTAIGPDEPRLPPETVQRIVRQSSGRFLGCVRRALRDDPRVKGRVVVRFTIAADGLVARAEEEQSTIADRDARQCLLWSFFELRFPPPPEGSVHVRYPLTIESGARRPPDELHEARRTAEPPPPGFAEAMRAGRPAQPAAPTRSVAPPPEPQPRSCGDDPMCGEL